MANKVFIIVNVCMKLIMKHVFKFDLNANRVLFDQKARSDQMKLKTHQNIMLLAQPPHHIRIIWRAAWCQYNVLSNQSIIHSIIGL